ncbi:hypothetical protein PHYBOEH_011693 [Phytophthora boehmeriae]|uniref:Uncharacterized protein n=1 Tax=Phytophthora boehmeriae TaxID=109152 RepID=A0A8T1WWC4_9STRA|nr:hypothetical protein PHYBOEH_011693 [Phytophthora boehmeriae]
MVDRLKLELKRALRKQMTEAVNDVCGAFEEELKQPPVAPKVGASAFESDYDCCRRLVEYIVRNMDTSSNFAQQMDCVILAYQSGASTEILNSVVTQDLWFKRRECSSLLFRSREDGGEEMQGGGEEDSVVVITGQIAASSEEALEIKLEKLRGVASDAGEGTSKAMGKEEAIVDEKACTAYCSGAETISTRTFAIDSGYGSDHRRRREF